MYTVINTTFYDHVEERIELNCFIDKCIKRQGKFNDIIRFIRLNGSSPNTHVHKSYP